MNTGRSIIIAGLAALLLAGAAQANTHSPPPTEFAPSAIRITNGGTAACGHVRALMAARSALETGDRAGALAHLKEARWLLSTCEGRSIGERGDRAQAYR